MEEEEEEDEARRGRGRKRRKKRKIRKKSGTERTKRPRTKGLKRGQGARRP